MISKVRVRKFRIALFIKTFKNSFDIIQLEVIRLKENKTIVRKTIDYIEAHLSDDIKLDDIAKEVGYSKYHLNRMYTESMGKTIHKYIQDRRLSESARKLAETEESIADIAQNSGYTSQQSYTLAFRQYFYTTPQVYRKLRKMQSHQADVSMLHKKERYNNVVAFSVRKGVMAA